MDAQQVFVAYDRHGEQAESAFRYCPRCASALPLGVPLGQRVTCPQCGWVYYHNPAPAVVVLVADGERVLLGKRGPSSFAPGLWGLPGGFVEFDEDFLTAGRREVREETGLEVEIDGLISAVTNFLSPVLHSLVVVLRAHPTGGTPAAGDDAVELGWFPLSGPLPPLAFPADEHIIARYSRTRLAGAPVDPRYARGPIGMPPG